MEKINILNHIAKLTQLDRNFLKKHVEPDSEENQLLDDFERHLIDGILPQEGHIFGLEAIILHRGRPVLFIKDNQLENIESDLWKTRLGDAETSINRNVKSVGRIEVPRHPNRDMAAAGEEFYVGSCVVIEDNVILTNRHVAEFFCTPDGKIILDYHPKVDFVEEIERDTDEELKITEVIHLSKTLDFALLRIEGNAPAPVERFDSPDILDPSGENRFVYIVGYPAFDERNPRDIQEKIYQGKYNVKRLAPGRLRSIQSKNNVMGHYTQELVCDYTSLGGNSGSPVFDLQTGKFIGLHYQGNYAEANYSIPIWKIDEDSANTSTRHPQWSGEELLRKVLKTSLTSAQSAYMEYAQTNSNQLIVSSLVLSFFGFRVPRQTNDFSNVPSNLSETLYAACSQIYRGYERTWESVSSLSPMAPSGHFTIESTFYQSGRTDLFESGPLIQAISLFQNTFE